mmetsp:Transcript_3495/g.15573  ORF Transcript_3495/g.15573 Transcript_3495/m.15573 type:complete len:458 (-) Transcript_3495:484-1857(-)
MDIISSSTRSHAPRQHLASASERSPPPVSACTQLGTHSCDVASRLACARVAAALLSPPNRNRAPASSSRKDSAPRSSAVALASLASSLSSSSFSSSSTSSSSSFLASSSSTPSASPQPTSSSSSSSSEEPELDSIRPAPDPSSTSASSSEGGSKALARCLPPHRCSAAYSAAAANAPRDIADDTSAAAAKTLDRDGRHRGSKPRPVASTNERASSLAGGASLGAENPNPPALALFLALAALAAASSASASARSASSRARVASARSAFPTCTAHARSRRNESCRTRIPRSRTDTAVRLSPAVSDDSCAPPPFTVLHAPDNFTARCASNAAPRETPRESVASRSGPSAAARFSKNSASSASGSSSSSSDTAVSSRPAEVAEDGLGGGPNAAATTGRAARDPTPMHRKPTRTISSPAFSSPSSPRMSSSGSSREISSELVARSGAMRVTPPETSVLGCRL